MKKILFLLFFLGLLAGGGAYLYFTDFNLIKKYITPRIPETVMSKIPEKIKKYITVEDNASNALNELGAPLDVPVTKFDSQYVSNDNPIFEAFRKGTKEDILKAIESTDNIDIFDVTGRTPLMYSAFRDDTSIAEVILNKGADINFKDRWGHTALMYAAKYGNANMVNYFLSKGADINVAGTDGETPVSAAAFDGNIDVLTKFLDYGADINIQDDYGNTPLMKAAINGNQKALQMLIEYGANVNSQNNDGLTALMLASESGRYNTAKLLLDNGADTSIKDKSGENVLDHARKFGHDHIIALLRQYMVVNEPQINNNGDTININLNNNSNIIMH